MTNKHTSLHHNRQSTPTAEAVTSSNTTPITIHWTGKQMTWLKEGEDREEQVMLRAVTSGPNEGRSRKLPTLFWYQIHLTFLLFNILTSNKMKKKMLTALCVTQKANKCVLITQQILRTLAYNSKATWWEQDGKGEYLEKSIATSPSARLTIFYNIIVKTTGIHVEGNRGQRLVDWLRTAQNEN